MTVLTPNEKVCEELYLMYGFTHYYRRYRKYFTFYAPSLPEENLTGYDGNLGLECRELYLQFKRVDPDSSTQDSFCFKINADQLAVLNREYPPYSAFYVVAAFANIAELLTAQYKHRVPKILDSYIAIPTSLVPIGTTKIWFCPECHKLRLDQCTHDSPPYCTSAIGVKHLNRKPLIPEWFRGSELFKLFETSKIGARIVKDVSGLVRRPTEYARVSNPDAAPIPILPQPASDKKRRKSEYLSVLRVCEGTEGEEEE